MKASTLYDSLRRALTPYLSPRILLVALIVDCGFLCMSLFTNAFSTDVEYSRLESVLMLFYTPQVLFCAVFADLVFGPGQHLPGLVYPFIAVIAFPICLLYSRVFFHVLTQPGLRLGCGLLALLVMVFLFLPVFFPNAFRPATGHMEKPYRMNCAANLKQIGLACSMYADDYKGAFPPDFQPLVIARYLDTFKIYLCPATRHQPATSAGELASPEHCDYLYFGKGLVREKVLNRAATVMACDRPGNHKGFWNVLFVDGHVMGFSGDDFRAVVRDNHLVLPAEPATK